MNKLRKLIWFLPSFIWMTIIFLFSNQHAETSNKNNFIIADALIEGKINLFKYIDYNFLNFLIRKAAHMTEYFILFMLLYFAFKNTFYKNIKIKASIITILYACTDEFHQIFIPGREGKIRDVFIDSIGVFVGLFLIYIFKFIRKYRKKE
ncbi:VanZ family protein [Clostridium sp. FAM 1755]|uniref:Teicoplanin resistance protein VanZ n=1 Tax=Clostridium botulinum TaxID=1491 RepID=A0A6M0SZ53_CLOBO|nr:VanZ family protein [Clostridium sporogenes]NFA59990.1 teicoplanin resistance protein VanZ [Clostridium botulinum]NFI73690.1 teicoplanin resistance protein VanZ [Clostridium sporogenes]NFM23870.1 teicoplanin resistance protein VanZ [Clostridium sporogenes]NFP61564.1 teicoplanin resistance protein VanZ [Clostridium sporogenes]NFU95103.1 teicoplanin resistance protein VanZ [Clostridium sporogenes]